MSKQRYDALYKEINKCKPKTIMEVGVWTGDNALNMCRVALRYRPRVIYYGFDLFEEITNKIFKYERSKASFPTLLEVEDKFLEAGLSIKYRLIQGFTRDTLPQFKPKTKIDFIFIDGGHSLETIENDWKYCSELADKDTVIVMDDYWPASVAGGCKKLVDGLDRDKWAVHLYDNPDKTKFGEVVHMVKIVNTRSGI